MSRTRHHDVRQRGDAHTDHVYWRARWYYRHGSKRGSAPIRRMINRRTRARDRDAIAHDRDPPPRAQSLAWVYW